MKKILIIFALCLSVLYGWYKYYQPSYTWNQKITINVETPSGLKSGSIVQKVLWRREMTFRGSPKRTYLKGEAASVDLGDGQHLFMVLSAFMSRFPLPVCTFSEDMAKARRDLYSIDNFRRMGRSYQKVGRKGEIPRECLRMMVTFDDITKPETVRRVDPDDLAVTFGPGYALKSVELEITNERVTQGRMKSTFTWFIGYNQWMKIRNSSGEVERLLSTKEFDTEIFK